MLLIGSDPEVFVLQQGKVSSAIGLVPGTKQKPHKTKHGYVQPDNVLAEFNIKPAKTRAAFIKSLHQVLGDLKDFTPELSIQASHVYDINELKAFGEEAFVFGCEPDFNAYQGGAPNPSPEAVNPGLRTAGGHLHLGYLPKGKREDMDDKCAIIRVLDLVLGIPSVLLDTDTVRKELYGKAGAFRPKDYGVEYRTLSNFWLASDTLMAWAYDGCHTALARKDELLPFIDGGMGNMIQDTINNNDKATAATLVREFNLAMPE